MAPSPPQKLLRQVAQLQTRLSEAEETLNAIRSGSIDALVVRTPRGEQLFTLKGADQTYRALVEAMNEGAVTLNAGTIVYCNHHFAKLTRAPLQNIIGKSVFQFIRALEFRRLLEVLECTRRKRGSLEATLSTPSGAQIPILVSASRFHSDGKTAVGVVVTDISERKQIERSRHELSRRILQAQELERQRVARDLHDGVNQLLSSAQYRLSNCLEGLASKRRAKADHLKCLVIAQNLVEKAISEVRVISRNLRPSELDDLGLTAALRTLVQEFQTQTGIQAQFRGDGQHPLPAEVDLAFYRIAQEALANIANHSKASHAEVALERLNSHAILTIQDNGKGLPKNTAPDRHKGWGLKNIRARASLLGGSLSVESGGTRGTCLKVAIPVAGQNASEINGNPLLTKSSIAFRKSDGSQN